MSKSPNGIMHGVTSTIFECMECGIRYESRNATGLAAKHWHKTGHHIVGVVDIGWGFPQRAVMNKITGGIE